MQALQFDVSVPRYLAGKALGALYRPFYWSGLSCLRYGDAAEPELPGPDWVKIRTRYGGICGSDWNLIHLHESPYLSPFGSQRFIVGHENLGTIVEVGAGAAAPQADGSAGWSPGERVVADIVLPCAVRGFAEPCPACQRGDYNRCQRFAEGDLAPGTILGACADTGGSWGPFYVAHRSQLLRVPGNVSDENAILLDALGTVLRPILRHFPGDGDTVLILGAGTIGLCAVATLRALGSRARLIVVAKYPYQGEMARRYGADEVVPLGRKQEHYHALAGLMGARLYKPILGKPALVGGADMVYECVGSSSSLDDALRLAVAGGKVILVGLASVPSGVDWTPIWFHELSLVGTYAVGIEEWQGRPARTYEVGLDLMTQGKLDLEPLLTHRFRLADYRQAFRALSARGSNGMLKAVFTFDG